MKTTVILLGFTLMILNYASIAQNKINLPLGQKFHQNTKQINTITQTIQGNDMEIKTNVTLDVDIEVKSVTTNFEISSTITRIQSHNEAMGKAIDFDSDKKEDLDGIIGKQFKSVIAKPFTTEVSFEGKAVASEKTKLDDETLKNALDMKASDLLEESLLPLPASFKVGDSFNGSGIDVDKDNEKKVSYKVENMDNGEAEISFSSTQKIRKTKTIQGMEAVVTGEAKSTGKLFVNIQTGIVLEKKESIDAKGTTEIMSQSIPFEMKQIVIVNNS